MIWIFEYTCLKRQISNGFEPTNKGFSTAKIVILKPSEMSVYSWVTHYACFHPICQTRLSISLIEIIGIFLWFSARIWKTKHWIMKRIVEFGSSIIFLAILGKCPIYNSYLSSSVISVLQTDPLLLLLSRSFVTVRKDPRLIVCHYSVN